MNMQVKLPDIKNLGKQIMLGLDPDRLESFEMHKVRDYRGRIESHELAEYAVFELGSTVFKCLNTPEAKTALGERLQKASFIPAFKLPAPHKLPKSTAAFSWTIARSFLLPNPDINSGSMVPEVDNFLAYMDLHGAPVRRAAMAKGEGYLVDLDLIIGTPFAIGRVVNLWSDDKSNLDRWGIHHLPTGLLVKGQFSNEKAALAYFKTIDKPLMDKLLEKAAAAPVINPI